MTGLARSKTPWINSKLQTLLRRSFQALGISLTLSVICSCAHGPNVTACILDPASRGFQCATKSSKFFLTYEKGQKLQCANPDDVEKFGDACKNHQLIPLTFCMVSHDFQSLKCFPPDGGLVFNLRIEEGDKYVCLSERDFERIVSRCK